MIQEIVNARIAHITSVLPSKKINNIDNPNFTLKEKQKIIKQTGIQSRYELDRSKGERLIDLYIKAANDTLKKLKWERESIKAIIVVSQSHEYIYPATACILQEKLGLSENIAAFDVSMGCSGYVYGLNIAFNYIANGMGRILLFVGEAISYAYHKDDRASVFLFGEGGSCTAIESKKDSKSTFHFKTIGSGSDSLIIKKGGSAEPFQYMDFKAIAQNGLDMQSGAFQEMDGIRIFDFSKEEVPQAMQHILQHTGLNLDQISRFYFHQANLFILDFLGEKLNIKNRLPINIQSVGNTSSCSIPLLLCDIQGSNIQQEKVMLVGFGVGLSIGIAILDLDCTLNLIGKQQ